MITRSRFFFDLCVIIFCRDFVANDLQTLAKTLLLKIRSLPTSQQKYT